MRRVPPFLLLLPACLLVVAAIGVVDFISGFETSLALFYLAPIAAMTWFKNITWGIAIAAASVAAWVAADIMAGIPHVLTWNVATGFLAYAIFATTLASLRNALLETHLRVERRTAALNSELAARKKLESEIVAVAERERDRVGRELHDNLCQHLTGTSLIAQGVANEIAAGNCDVSSAAQRVVDLVNRANNLAREVARGLFSFELQDDGLASAVSSLAREVSRQSNIRCEVSEKLAVPVSKETATHVYWIVNEALMNAVRHGSAQNISIELTSRESTLNLTVKDDGKGFSVDSVNGDGIGLRIMKQRAQLASGSLDVTSGVSGTVVKGRLPLA